MTLNTLSTAARNAMADALTGVIDGGGGAGKLKFYTSEGGTLLATLTFSATSFGAASGGVATAATITGANAAANGTVTIVHVTDFADAVTFKGTAAASAADIIFTNAVWAINDPISISSLTITQPAS